MLGCQLLSTVQLTRVGIDVRMELEEPILFVKCPMTGIVDDQEVMRPVVLVNKIHDCQIEL